MNNVQWTLDTRSYKHGVNLTLHYIKGVKFYTLYCIESVKLPPYYIDGVKLILHYTCISSFRQT